jgi:hypothetical protein
MKPKDSVVVAGHRIGVMILSRDERQRSARRPARS